MITQFDIVIAGAGISGLLIASELSAKKRVLVVETKQEQEPTKYWVTLKSCIESNPDLVDFVDLYFNHMDFSDAYQNEFRLNGEYVLWESKGLTEYLKKKILSNGGEIRFDQRFCGYKTKSNSIEIFVNNICLTCKLFIDCMGYNSPLVLAKDMIDIKGYYLLYGAKLPLKETIDPVCLSNIMLDKRPKFFEVFPTSNMEAFTTVIYPTNTLTDLKGLANDFKFITTKSIYSKYFHSNEIISRLWGIIPVGNIRRKALDRIFFFGESAQSNPAATQTCLTRLLLNYKRVADFLDEKIEKNELTEKALSQSPVVLNTFNRKLQLFTFKDILSWNSDRFSKFISMIDRIDHAVINKFIFGDLTTNDIFKKNHFFALLKPKNYFFTKPLMRSLR